MLDVCFHSFQSAQCVLSDFMFIIAEQTVLSLSGISINCSSWSFVLSLQLKVILCITVLAADLWRPVLLIIKTKRQYIQVTEINLTKSSIVRRCRLLSFFKIWENLKVETKDENKQLLEWKRVLVHSVQIILRLCLIWHYCSLVVLKGFDFLFKPFLLSQMECGLLFCLILMLFIVVISWFAG